MNTWNHYTCESCQKVTIAKHEDEGVTPMFFPCQATVGCSGDAMSSMYRVSQDNTQVPHVIWFRCKTEAEIVAFLKTRPVAQHLGWRAHHAQGGCFWRPGPAGFSVTVAS